MKKKICLVGSSGYIGQNIYRILKKNEDYEIYKYSSKSNRFIDKCNLNKFDYLIISAGIHTSSEYDNSKIFLQNKKIIRNTFQLIDISTNIIFISSFKTSFNLNKNYITEENVYNFYNFDSYYGKSKIIVEKLYEKIFKNLSKNYLILSPSHVIGPEDSKGSLNNAFLHEIYKKKIIFYPKCFISLVDVRNIAHFIKETISKNKFFCKKIILNDISLEMKDYISLIKKDQIYLSIMISSKLINILFKTQSFINYILRTKLEFISYSRVNYINLNPKTIINKYSRKYNYTETINDVKKIKFFFS